MEIPLSTQEESFPSMQYNLESYLGQQPLSPPERYPIPNTGAENEVDATYISYGFQSIEENKEFLVTARNTLDILSSILNSDTEPKPLKVNLFLKLINSFLQITMIFLTYSTFLLLLLRIYCLVLIFVAHSHIWVSADETAN